MDFTSLQRRPGQVTYGRRSKRARPSTFDAADEEADSQGSLVTDNNTATGSEKAIGLARPSSASPSKDTRGQASPTKARKDSGKGKARQVDPAPPSEFSAPNGESRTGKAPTYTSSAARERTLCPTTPRPKRPRSNPSVHSPRSVNGSIGSPSARSPGTPTRPAQDLRALFEHVSPSAPADLEARTAKQRKREGSPTPLAALGNSATTSQAMEPEGQGTARRPRLVELMAGRRERVSGTSASRMGPDNETGTEQGGQASGSPFASAHLQAARASALKSNHITASADATASSSALPAGGVSAARTYARAGSWRRSSTEPSTRLGLATDAGSYSKPEHWPSDVQYTQENMEAQSQPQMFSPGASGSPSGLGSRSRSMLRANSGQGELRLGGHMGADAGGAGGASQGRTSSLGVAGSGARRTYGLQRSFLTEIDPAFSDMGMSSGLDNVWSGGVSRDTQSGGASGMFGSSHGKVEGDKGLDALVEGAQARMGPLARFAPMPRQRESYAELRRKWGDGEESGDEDDEVSHLNFFERVQCGPT